MKKITVAITSHRRTALLERLLESLKVQSMDHELLVEEMLPGETVSDVRNRLYQRASSEWVLFLDEDCVLPRADHLERVIAATPGGYAVGGGYLDLSTSGFWQRAYNALVSLWLTRHHDEGVLVAGNFALPAGIKFAEGFPFKCGVPAGGEEVELLRSLKKIGLKIRLSHELDVYHDGGKNFVGFFKTAWLHGRSQYLESRETGRMNIWRGLKQVPRWQVRGAMLAYLGIVWVARQISFR